MILTEKETARTKKKNGSKHCLASTGVDGAAVASM
jgi:hypothetical protein